MELLEALEPGAGPEVVLITGHASLETAVDALRRGADYLTKPVDLARLKVTLAALARTVEMKRQIGTLRTELRRLGRLVGGSPALQRVYDRIARVAPHRGDRRDVRRGRSSRSTAGRCHRRPSRARCSASTLFLDEITEMPQELQVKLLRVLESGSVTRVGGTETTRVDVRVVTATNRRPEEAVAQGNLRQDLLSRLNVFPIQLPPLRERGDGVPLLAEQFLDEMNTVHGTRRSFTRACLDRLRRHGWPGNVRELKASSRRSSTSRATGSARRPSGRSA